MPHPNRVKSKESSNRTREEFEGATPDVAFERARNEYMTANGRPIVDRSRYFVLATLMSLVSLVLAIALWQLFPLKSVEPYTIGVDASRGLVGRADVQVMPANQYTPERPVVERELFQFISKLYALNAEYPKTVKDGHVQAYAYTRGRATQEFKSFIDSDQPYQRMTKTPGLVRFAERGTFNFREDGKLVLIRYRTSERDINRPVAISRDWVMALQFERIQPTEKAELDVNPLGIYITHFEISEER